MKAQRPGDLVSSIMTSRDQTGGTAAAVGIAALLAALLLMAIA